MLGVGSTQTVWDKRGPYVGTIVKQVEVDGKANTFTNSNVPFQLMPILKSQQTMIRLQTFHLNNSQVG